MSKAYWIAENERILRMYQEGDITLGDAGEHLRDLGHGPREIREMLSEFELETIPVGYFGEEDDRP